MRIRSIRPEFWQSEDVAAMDWHTRLIFIGLWSYVDDNGVGRDDERLIRAALFPLDDDQSESSRRLAAGIRDLAVGGQVARYEVAGKRYLHITAWSANQRTDNAGKQRYPLPTCEDSVSSDLAASERTGSPRLAADRGDSLLGEGEKGRRGEVKKGSVVELDNHLTVGTPTRDEVDLVEIARATHGDEHHARRVTRDVLVKASVRPTDPTAFVIAAVRADPARHRSHAGNPGQCTTHATPLPCSPCAADRKANA